jgi:hypothetical protein
MKSVGNRRVVMADYLLTDAPGGATQLDLRRRRRMSLLEFTPRPKATQDWEGKRAWGRFARALERDDRKVTKFSKRRSDLSTQPAAGPSVESRRRISGFDPNALGYFRKMGRHVRASSPRPPEVLSILPSGAPRHCD